MPVPLLDMSMVQEQGQKTASHPCASGATAKAVSTVEVAEAPLQLSQYMKDVPDIMCTQDKGIQVDVDSILGKQFKLVDMLTSDNTVLAFTRVSSMTLLVAISNEVSRIEDAVAEMSLLRVMCADDD